MKIDPQIPAPGNSGTNPVRDSQAERTKNSSVRHATTPNDTVHLSSDQTTVRRLVSQLDQVPEVRNDRVQALRSEIQSGKFQPSNEQVAGALVTELLRGRSNR